MTRTDAAASNDAVGEALRERRSDFEAFVRSRVRPDQVDDVLQTAAMRAIERAESLDDPERVVAWLYRIHRNLVIDTWRRGAATTDRIESTAHVPERAEPPITESCDCSVAQSRRLRPAYATILQLVDTDGMAVPTAADTLGISANNAAVRLHRARKALRAAMFEHCGVTEPQDCAVCRCVDDVCCDAA